MISWMLSPASLNSCVLKHRQTAQAAKCDQQIDRHFRDNNSNFDVAVGDERGDEPEPGDHHRGVREKTRRFGVDGGEVCGKPRADIALSRLRKLAS